jgi:tRNA (guanine37-N1)-methyltransferase
MRLRTNSIRVTLTEAEKTRKYLMEKKILRDDLKIFKDKKFIYFPISNVTKNIESYIIEKKEFEKKEIKPKSYKEIVSIPNNLKNELPTSFDVIGELILIKLPKNLIKYQKEIGEALLEVNKNIKSVYKIEAISGEFRIRNIKLLSGEKNTITTHKEYGLSYDIDIQKTYFSQRLSNERKRVANLVKNKETIVDMFTGVAPFAITIAKYANPKIVYAIDKNIAAIKYAKQNIKKNNVLDKIEVINVDAKDIPSSIKNKADRIIMNLPFSSHLFFSNALDIAKDRCIIHYYDILEEKLISDRVDELKKIANKNRVKLTNLEIRKIKTYSPREFYIGIDITAKKMPM